MIKLLTKQHGKAVRLLCDKLHCDGIQYDLLVTTCEQSARKYLADAIKNDNVINVRNNIEKRKVLNEELKHINSRIRELEKASIYVGRNLPYEMQVYKLSVGMDNMSQKSKDDSTSFALSMNAVEGVCLSERTAKAIEDWKNVKVTFLSVFNNTLKYYGFPTEG